MSRTVLQSYNGIETPRKGQYAISSILCHYLLAQISKVSCQNFYKSFISVQKG